MEPARSRASFVTLRMNRGLSVAAAADEMGLARGTLASFERGESVSLASAKMIADFHGCSVVELLAFEGPSTPASKAA
jgi:transcriptional regulator with XRE-family HTH domain